MNIAPIKTGCFSELFKQQAASFKGACGVDGLARREAAMSRFLATGIPTTRNEDWKYTSLRHVADADFIIPSSLPPVGSEDLERILIDGAVPLVFVDGILSRELSKMDELEPGLSVELDSVDKFEGKEATGFAALNAAFAVSGVAIELAADHSIKAPVQIIHFATGNAFVGFVRNSLTLARGSKLELVESFANLSESGDMGLQSSSFDIVVSEFANLSHVRIQAIGSQQTDISSVNVEVHKSANYKTFTFSTNGRVIRNNLAISLVGREATAEILGLTTARNSEHIDHFTSVDHRVPQALSRQVYANVLDDKSRSVFTGRVMVQKDAQSTSAFQLNKNLLLSADAEIDTRPQLQIDADDVKCSHGATIGQLNPNEIFYLQTRGIKKSAAEAMLARAFANEVLLECPVAAAKEIIQTHLNEYFL